MANGTAIAVSNLSKTYRISHQHRSSRATEALVDFARRPFRRPQVELFDALHRLDFEIPQGEAVGIIGRNGAGKSTLLKLLTRITAPTTGRIELHGRIGSLLEVGTGFHPELTGRENIFLNGTLLGMRRREILRRFDEIVEFAGVERFLDTPVKRYSSGMYVRLAFAVAAHLETEILAIDEVLAVGDAEFQRKSIAKMRDVAADGRTVLFVSHQMHTVLNLCTSALFLQAGRLAHQGDVETAMQHYRDTFEDHAVAQLEAARRPGNGQLRADTVTMPKGLYASAEPKSVHDHGADRSARDRQLLRLVPRHRCERRHRDAVRLPARGHVARPRGAARAHAHDRRPHAPARALLGGRVPLLGGRHGQVGGGRDLRDPPDPAVSRDGRRGRVHPRHRAVGLQVRGELSRERVLDARVRTAPLANPTGAMRIESQASAAAARKRRAFR